MKKIVINSLQLKPDQLLSRNICEYCHSEMVRFSVWKKELIAKQMQLYKLLDQQISANEKDDGDDDEELEEKMKVNGDDSETDGEITSILDDEQNRENIIDNEQHSSDDDNDVSSDDDNDVSSDNTEIINCDSNEELEESESETGTYASHNDHESDVDFNLLAREKLKSSKTSRNSNLLCRKCNSSFLAQKGLTMHEKHCKGLARIVKSEERSVKSDTNEVKVKKKHSRRLARLKDMDAKFVCNLCAERFRSERNLNIHRAHAHKNERHIFKVPPKRVSSESNGVQSRQAEIEMPQFSCLKCSFQTKTNKLFEHHMRSHVSNSVPNTSTECPHCNKNFSARSALVTHIQTVHSNQRRFKCDLCGTKFKQLCHLKDHYSSIHQKQHKVGA
jgi:hypothetical protein